MLLHHVLLLNFRKEKSATPAVLTVIVAPYSAKTAPAATFQNCYSTQHAFQVAQMNTIPAMEVTVKHAPATARSATHQPTACRAALVLSCSATTAVGRVVPLLLTTIPMNA